MQKNKILEDQKFHTLLRTVVVVMLVAVGIVVVALVVAAMVVLDMAVVVTMVVVSLWRRWWDKYCDPPH